MLLILGGERDNTPTVWWQAGMLLILVDEQKILLLFDFERDNMYCCYWVVSRIICGCREPSGIILLLLGGERDNTADIG
jgi:hypothetical protein